MLICRLKIVIVITLYFYYVFFKKLNIHDKIIRIKQNKTNSNYGIEPNGTKLIWFGLILL